MRPASLLLSYVFHPLLVPAYFILILYWINPIFLDFSDEKVSQILIITFLLSTIGLPAFAIYMMKALDLIGSLEMKDKKERIGPLMVTGIFYLWIYLNFKRNEGMPEYVTYFSLGCTISIFLCFLITLFYKVSLHAVGFAGLIQGLLIIKNKYHFSQFGVKFFKTNYIIDTNLIILILILIMGLIGTARVYLKDHDTKQIYYGYLTGSVSLLLAYVYIY